MPNLTLPKCIKDDDAHVRLFEALHAENVTLNADQKQWRDIWLQNPAGPESLLNAGRLSESLGQPAWARHFLQRCLEIDPECLPANSRLGMLAAREQNWGAAITFLAKAVVGEPPNEACLANLGTALYMSGEENDALSLLEKAHTQNPDSDTLTKSLFYVALWNGQMELARRTVDHALETALQPITAHALEEAGGLIKFANTPLENWPRVAVAQLATQSGDYARASSLYLELVPDQPRMGYSGLGVIAMATGQFEPALTYFERAIAAAAAPNAQLHLNCAKALAALSKHDAAITSLERALEIDPQFIAARLERGIAELRRGNWERGWADYEARRQFAPDNLFSFFDSAAEWRGEPLEGKTIILVGEQGQGDVIQLARFARDLSRCHAEVVVHCVPSLYRLIGSVPGVARVFTVGETIPPYDYWVPLASVPRLIGLRLETLRWDGPYIRPPDTDTEAWRLRLAKYTGFRVGLVWAGNDYHGHIWHQLYDRRNLSINDFLPLIDRPGATFFSIQKGDARKQLEHFAAKENLIDHADEWHDFQDTAAFIANLDLVITVDTSVAHLAGALGKPVWIISRTDGCWRWLDRREDSPWYPSARLFHQGVGEHWATVIGRIEAALSRSEWQAERDSGPPGRM